jgi:hypothetical protein
MRADSPGAGKEKNMGVALEQGEYSSTIRLEGAIGIASSAELKRLLLQALELSADVRISVEDAIDLDVTAMQLLWAAKRMAGASGVAFAFQGKARERVSAVLAQAGLERFVPGGEGN